MANNTIKYLRLDPTLRARDRARWNKPLLWPLGVLFAVLVGGMLPAVFAYRRKQGQVNR
jgi:oligopeptide transport system substrate-binding protein